MRRLVLLLCLLSAACADGVSQVRTLADQSSKACVEFAQADCLRLDIPSVLQKGVPYAADGTPDFQQTLAAMRAGAVKSAGKRSITIFIWGMDPGVTAGMLAQYVRDSVDGAPSKMGIVEINTSDAPKFDPAHKPSGVVRAFRLDFTGAIVSFQIPKWGIGDDMYALICPEGRSIFPDRVNAQDGLWSLPPFWRTMKNTPRFNYATRKPMVWSDTARKGPFAM